MIINQVIAEAAPGLTHLNLSGLHGDAVSQPQLFGPLAGLQQLRSLRLAKRRPTYIFPHEHQLIVNPQRMHDLLMREFGDNRFPGYFFVGPAFAPHLEDLWRGALADPRMAEEDADGGNEEGYGQDAVWDPNLQVPALPAGPPPLVAVPPLPPNDNPPQWVVDLCAAAPHLRTLSLGHWDGISRVVIAGLARGLTHLTFLDLSGVVLSPSLLDALPILTSLQVKACRLSI